MVLFHIYDIIGWRAMITVIYGLFIHVNVGPSQMFTKKYLEINAKNLQYYVNVILAGMYIKK